MSACLEPAPKLRRMRPGDVDRVMEVEQGAYPFPWTEGIFRDCMRVGYGCWVLECDGDLVGHAVIAVAAGEAHLLNLTIDVQHQGQGLGRFLLRGMVAQVRSEGVETLFLEARPSNLAALRLYRSEGFTQVGVRARYYPAPDGREDAWVFSVRP
jgi:[ribosomal protein S18]-alanine N-acetyltransferase